MCRIVTQPGEGERCQNQPYREAVHLRCQGLPSKPTISGSAGSTGIAGDSGWCVAPRRWPDGFACSSDGVNWHVSHPTGEMLYQKQGSSWDHGETHRALAAVGTLVTLSPLQREVEGRKNIFQEMFVDFLPQAFGSMLSKSLLCLSTISTSSKENKSKGGPCWGTVPSTDPYPACAAECWGCCRTSCSVPLLFLWGFLDAAGQGNLGWCAGSFFLCFACNFRGFFATLDLQFPK